MSTESTSSDGSQPLFAPAQNGDSVPWARQTPRSQERTTTRLRQTVENLPDWEPLPPGEIIALRRDRSS